MSIPKGYLKFEIYLRLVCEFDMFKYIPKIISPYNSEYNHWRRRSKIRWYFLAWERNYFYCYCEWSCPWTIPKIISLYYLKYMYTTGIFMYEISKIVVCLKKELLFCYCELNFPAVILIIFFRKYSLQKLSIIDF